jgi:hypothetical protein
VTEEALEDGGFGVVILISTGISSGETIWVLRRNLTPSYIDLSIAGGKAGSEV